jgi:hypothetical protein
MNVERKKKKKGGEEIGGKREEAPTPSPFTSNSVLKLRCKIFFAKI